MQPIPKTLINHIDSHFNDPKCNGSTLGVYALTNEVGVPEVAEFIQKTPSLEGRTCYIGFSGLHNFNLIALSKPDISFILDFNPDNANLIKEATTYLKESESKEEFLKEISDYIREDSRPSLNGDKMKLSDHAIGDPDLDTADHFCLQIQNPSSWLYKDERFKYMRDLAYAKRIIPLTIDITDTQRIRNFRSFLEANAYTTRTLYLSNIGNYMETPELQTSYLNSVKSLFQEETIVIDCHRKPCSQKYKWDYLTGAPIQTAYLGKDFNEANYFPKRPSTPDEKGL